MKQIFLILPLLLLTACSGKLTRPQAEKILEDNYRFNQWQEFVEVPIGGSAEQVDPVQRVLIKEGYIAVTPQAQSTKHSWLVGAGAPQATSAQSVVAITPKGEKAMINTSAAENLGALLGYGAATRVENWILPIAQVKLVKVSRIKEEANKATAEFVFRWQLDDLGKRLVNADPDNEQVQRIARQHLSTLATFEKYDDGWRLTGISR